MGYRKYIGYSVARDQRLPANQWIYKYYEVCHAHQPPKLRTAMAACMYVIVLVCACVLGGVSANDECSEPVAHVGQFVCAVIARDSLCQNGTVTNETCQNCTQLESLCGLPQLTNETCEDIGENTIQYCLNFRAVNCTGDPANITDGEQLRLCDYCLVIERECPTPPPSYCYESRALFACSAAERLEQNYTCTELFPPEEDDEGPCQLCENYEALCGFPLSEVINTTNICTADVWTVVRCNAISMTEECTNIEDPEQALVCAYCSFVSEANYCNETDFCEFFDESTIQYCPFTFAVNCTGDPANRTDEQQERCDYCGFVIEQDCSAPPISQCYETGVLIVCSAVEQLEQNYTCTELFPPEEDDDGPCQLCENYEALCGFPLSEVINTTNICTDNEIVLQCYIISMREECEEDLDTEDPQEALECAYCSFVSDANCTLPPPTGDDEICNETGLESFCATVLREGLCPGMLAEETCENCFIFEVFCGPPEGAIEDLCDNAEIKEDCAEIEPICSMDDIPQDNITLCEGCELLAERCPVSTLPVRYPAKILQIDTICPSSEEREIYMAEIVEEIRTIIQDTVLPILGLSQD